VTHWRDHPAVRMATERLERGREALEAARAQVTTLAAEVERARARVHEVSVAVQLGEQPPAALEEARAALAEADRRLEEAREVAAAVQGALEVLARRHDEATALAREEVDAHLAAQRRLLAERLGALLAEAAQVNRELLRVEDLRRQNGLSVDEPLAWGELLPLAEPKVLRNKTLTFDWAVGTERCLLALWLDRARRAGCQVPEVEPTSLADAVPSRFGRVR